MKERLTYFGALKFLSEYIRRYRSNFICFYIGWLLDAGLAISMPILFGVMIDEIVYYQNVDTFVRISVLFVILSVFSCLLYFMIYAQHHYLMGMFTLDIKMDMLEHFLKCDAKYMSTLATGNTLVTMQNYAEECMHFVIRNLCHFVNNILSVIVVATYLLVIDWKIGMVAIAVAPISVVVNKKVGRKVRDKGEEFRESYGEYMGWFFEMASAFRELRMFRMQERVNREFREKHQNMFSAELGSGILKYLGERFTSFFHLCIRLLIFFLAGYAALNGNITVGLLTVVISFYESLVSKITRIGNAWLDSQERISYIQRICDFMKLPVENERNGERQIHISKGEIEFLDVKFSYDNSDALLEHFNLKIKAGERLGLVGRSGAGKTTVAYMLTGFYQPDSGRIRIECQDIQEVSLKSLRKNIGLVQQRTMLIDGTVRENIVMGNLHAADEEIRHACMQAGIWEFVESLPEKLETVIGKRGIGLSGGQKQRIAIARIYLRNPAIIIFDEATASLDSETEELIHSEWEKVLEGRTAIIVSHRKSSVLFCDRVAILEDGKIVETGTPDDMNRNSKRFKEIFAVQEGADD